MFRFFIRKWVVYTVLLATLLLAACSPASTPTPATSNSAATATVSSSPTTVSEPASPAPNPTATTTTASVEPVSSKLNLNTVTADELLNTIPGFGNRMVREFQEYRPYVSLTQFRKEIGKYVDAAQVAEYEKYVYVPIDVNQSDAATLLQIPGLTESQANALIAARPFASNEAFTVKLTEFLSAEAVTTAQAYLSTP